MQEHEIERIVAKVLAEQKRLHNNDADEVVLKTISTILTSFGIEEEDRKELRADFQHLRRWRKSTEQIDRAVKRAVITVVITGICGAIWMGIKTALGK
jgi:hypothetical protein